MRGTQLTRWITSPSSRSNLTLRTGLTRRGVVIDGEDRELESRAAIRVVSELHSGAAFENGREAGRRLNRPDVYMIHDTARRCSGSVYACGWVLASDIATLRLCLVFLGRKATTPLPHPPSSSLLPLPYPPHLSTSLHISPPPSSLPPPSIHLSPPPSSSEVPLKCQATKRARPREHHAREAARRWISRSNLNPSSNSNSHSEPGVGLGYLKV